jgi:hypothetical protein
VKVSAEFEIGSLQNCEFLDNVFLDLGILLDRHQYYKGANYQYIQDRKVE